ncbi:tyrosine--tRNA ligase [Candidatus Pacearchaeota archaeon]|nr:tyrosine--tRNA ligase [Candidatus Pacearchaeota archaeon]
MNVNEKLDLIKRNTEEIVTEEELTKLLKEKKKPIVYCGYEPNGPMHLGHFVTITKLKDLESAGFKVIILLADLHAMLNRKSEESIKKEIENWKKTIKAIGIKAEVVLGSSFQFSKEYQFDVMKASQSMSINRGLRSMQEVARDIENATISQLWYPLMQVADIKHLGVDIALGGLEQRKIHMLGKDIENTTGYKFIAIHTPLITSLKGPGSKMSKSIPGSGISITDSNEEIKKAISEAYCPIKETKDNPVLQINRLIVFPLLKRVKIKRPSKFGGDKEYNNYQEMEKEYEKGNLHPLDLKNATIISLEEIIKPIRNNLK